MGVNGARSQDRYQETRELTFIAGEKSAHLYESSQALPLIYSVDNLEAARAKQALSQASLNALREEDLRKQRIPIQIVLDLIDKVFQSIGSTLKAAKGKKLTPERINEVFDKFRAAPRISVGRVDTLRCGKWQPFKNRSEL